MGAVVQAYDPDGVLVGQSVVQWPGVWGITPVYADDPTTPEDEGAVEGDPITLLVNGLPASISGDSTWHTRSLAQVELHVGEGPVHLYFPLIVK